VNGIAFRDRAVRHVLVFVEGDSLLYLFFDEGAQLKLARIKEGHNLLENCVGYVIYCDLMLLRLNEAIAQKHGFKLLTQLGYYYLVTVEWPPFHQKSHIRKLFIVKHFMNTSK